jgi:primosomal protein N'
METLTGGYEKEENERTEFIGPAPFDIAKVNQKFKFQINIKTNCKEKVRAAVYGALLSFDKSGYGKKVGFFADLNPSIFW